MRYGVIRTQKKEGDGISLGPAHWLRRGTPVRIAADARQLGIRVETMFPVFGVPIFGVASSRYKVREQYVTADDVVELPQWLGPFLEWFAPKFQRVREWFCLA
ncbi:hypothetical protein WJ23_33210 [Burkholderia lata]|nr:hypothetical protein WJ23_33210 [Burkholderia lata]